MRSWSIPAGRLFGIEIRIHLTFFFLVLFVWSAESATQDSATALPALALVGVIFASVVLHDLGQAWVSRREGVPAKGIILLPIGGVTILDEAQATPDSDSTWVRDIRIACVGPLVNLAIAGVAALVLIALIPGVPLLARPLVVPGHLARSVVWLNVYLALLNLLPSYPVDGGRVLRAYFSRHMDPIRATQRAVRIAHVFATLFMMLGFLLSNYPDTRADGLWLLMIGCFLFAGPQPEAPSSALTP